MIAARFFDGRSAQGRPVQLHAAGGVLRIIGEAFEIQVPAADLSFAVSHSRAPTRLSLRSGGICEFPASVEATQLLRDLGARASLADRLAAHRGAVLATLAVFIALMAAIWTRGIPWAADVIVDHVPASWEANLGASVLGQLEDRGIFRPSALDAARRDRLVQRFDALRIPGRAPDHAIVFRRLGVPNAFALPGGTIVVADELVALAGDDDTALLTVLGHELGHLAHRHSLHALVQAALFSAFAAWYFGDVSTFVASAGAGLTALHYSRAAENAADQYALQLMRANGVSTRPAADLFRQLAGGGAEAQGDADARGRSKPGMAGHLEVPEYLSTHPDIRARIALFDEGAAQAPH